MKMQCNNCHKLSAGANRENAMRNIVHTTGCFVIADGFKPKNYHEVLDYTCEEAETIGEVIEGLKYDADKPQMQLLDNLAMIELAKVLTFGAKKYAPNNWRNGISSSRLLAACLRHVFAYLGGQKNDEETGLSHLAHAMCCLMFAINLAKTKPELSDHYFATAPTAKKEGD